MSELSADSVFTKFRSHTRLYLTKHELRCCIIFVTGNKPPSLEIERLWSQYKR